MEEKSGPVITMESARLAAENEIRDRNGELSLKLTDSQVNSNPATMFLIIAGLSMGFPPSMTASGRGSMHSPGKSVRTPRVGDVPENAVAASSVPAISQEAGNSTR